MASRRAVLSFVPRFKGARNGSTFQGEFAVAARPSVVSVTDGRIAQKKLDVRVPAQHGVIAPDLRARGNESAKVFIRDGRWGYCTRDETGRLSARFDFSTEMAAAHHLEECSKIVSQPIKTLENNRKTLWKYSSVLGENGLGANEVITKVLFGKQKKDVSETNVTNTVREDGKLPKSWQQKGISHELEITTEQVAAALSRHVSTEERRLFYNEVMEYIRSPFQNSKTRDYFLRRWLARDSKLPHSSVYYRLVRPMLGITDADLESLAQIDAKSSDAIHVVSRAFNIGKSEARRKSDRTELYWVVPPPEVVEACHEHSTEAARVIELESDLGLEMETLGLAKAKGNLLLSQLLSETDLSGMTNASLVTTLQQTDDVTNKGELSTIAAEGGMTTTVGNANKGELAKNSKKRGTDDWIAQLVREESLKPVLEKYISKTPFKLDINDRVSLTNHLKFLRDPKELPRNPLDGMPRSEIASKAKALKAVAWPGQERLSGSLLRKAFIMDVTLSDVLYHTSNLDTDFVVNARYLVEHLRSTTSWADRLKYHIALNESMAIPGETPSAQLVDRFFALQQQFAEHCCLDQSPEFFNRLSTVIGTPTATNNVLEPCELNSTFMERLELLQQQVEDGLLRVANAPQRVWNEGYFRREADATAVNGLSSQWFDIGARDVSSAATFENDTTSVNSNPSLIYGPPTYSDLKLGTRTVGGQLEWLGHDNHWYSSADAAANTWYHENFGAPGTFEGEANILGAFRRVLYAADRPEVLAELHDAVKPEDEFQAAIFATRAILVAHPDPEISRNIVYDFVSNLWPFGRQHANQNQYRNQHVDREEKLWQPTSRDQFVDSLRQVVDNRTATQLAQWGVPSMQHITPELVDRAYNLLFHQSLGSSREKQKRVAAQVLDMQKNTSEATELQLSNKQVSRNHSGSQMYPHIGVVRPPILPLGLSEEEFSSRTVVLSKIPSCVPKEFLQGVLEKRFGRILSMEWYNEATVLNDRMRNEKSRVLSLLRKYFKGRPPAPKKKNAALHRAVLRALANDIPSFNELEYSVSERRQSCVLARKNAKQCEIDTELIWHDFKDKWNSIVDQGSVDPRTVFDVATPQIALRDMDRRALRIADNLDVSEAMTFALEDQVKSLSWMWSNLKCQIVSAVDEERKQNLSYHEDKLIEEELNDLEVGVMKPEGYTLDPEIEKLGEPMEAWDATILQPEHIVPRNLDELCDLRSGHLELSRLLDEVLSTKGPKEFMDLPKSGRRTVLRNLVPFVDAYLILWQETICMQAVVDEKLVEFQDLVDEQRRGFQNVSAVAPVIGQNNPIRNKSNEVVVSETETTSDEEWMEDEPVGPRYSEPMPDETTDNFADDDGDSQVKNRKPVVSPKKLKKLTADKSFQFSVATAARSKFLNRQLVLAHKWSQESSRGEKHFKKLSHDEVTRAPTRVLKAIPDEVQLDCGTYAHVVFEDEASASQLVRKVNLMFGLSVSVPVRYLAENRLQPDSPEEARAAGHRDIRIPVPKSDLADSTSLVDQFDKGDKRSEFSHFAMKVSSAQDEVVLRVCAIPQSVSDQDAKEKITAMLGTQFAPKDRVRIKRPKDAVGGARVAEIRFESLGKAAEARAHLRARTLGGQPMVVGWKHDARKFKKKFVAGNGDVEQLSPEAARAKKNAARVSSQVARVNAMNQDRAGSSSKPRTQSRATPERKHKAPIIVAEFTQPQSERETESSGDAKYWQGVQVN